jgi:hypothetical protein
MFRNVLAVVLVASLSSAVVAANEYKLVGFPSGLTSSSGGPVLVGNLLSISAGGANAFCHGPATFTFVWNRDAAKPEPPPLTAIVKIDTLATAWDNSGYGYSNNGWESALPGPFVSKSASEYVVKSNPGETFTMTANPASSIGPNGGFCTAQVEMNVIPVVVSLGANVQWWQSGVITAQTEEDEPVAVPGSPPSPPVFQVPYTPHIMQSALAMGSLTAGSLGFKQPPVVGASTYQWTIGEDYFLNWDPGTTSPFSAPVFLGPSSVEVNTANPLWKWKGTQTKPATVQATGVVMMPNVYNPAEATVVDNFTVEVVRPTISVGPLTFDRQKPWERIVPPQSYQVETLANIEVGTVNQPLQASSSKYAFAQVIKSSKRTGFFVHPVIMGALDGDYPYLYRVQVYANGHESQFEDSPYQSANILPVSAEDEFDLFLMYKSDASFSSWVPLARLEWSWKAKYGGTPSDFTQSSSPWVPTALHPEWTSVELPN